jgi:hypothetical protein
MAGTVRVLILATAIAIAFDQGSALADWHVESAASGAVVAASGIASPESKPWIVHRVLAVQGVAVLCRAHAGAHFIASVRGYLEAVPLNGPGGGWVGRLFTQPNPHAFFANDRKPFVQVWDTKIWSLTSTHHRVTFHGVLTCDAATNGELPGWQGSIRPDRYVIVQAGARSGAPVELFTGAQRKYNLLPPFNGWKVTVTGISAPRPGGQERKHQEATAHYCHGHHRGR